MASDMHKEVFSRPEMASSTSAFRRPNPEARHPTPGEESPQQSQQSQRQTSTLARKVAPPPLDREKPQTVSFRDAQCPAQTCSLTSTSSAPNKINVQERIRSYESKKKSPGDVPLVFPLHVRKFQRRNGNGSPVTTTTATLPRPETPIYRSNLSQGTVIHEPVPLRKPSIPSTIEAMSQVETKKTTPPNEGRQLVVTKELGVGWDAMILERGGKLEKVIINSRTEQENAAMLAKLSKELISVSNALIKAEEDVASNLIGVVSLESKGNNET